MTRLHRVTAVAVFLASSITAAAAGAQVCLGGSPTSRGWIAAGYGLASGSAVVLGADAAWTLSPSLALFGDASVTRYPAPDPARKRMALGGAYVVRASERSGICLVSGVDAERIGDLSVLRVPVGLSLGRSTPFSNGRGRLGLVLEPFVALSQESVDDYMHRWVYVNARAGVVLGYDRLMLALEHEHAFDSDARWNVRARFGIALK